jgi:dephospho-CoA kinase
MKVIGITGGIGSGKSLVCSIIEKIGFPVFYSDIEARKLVVSDQNIIEKLSALIGPTLYENGFFHKEILAHSIFNDASIKEKVNQIIHPRVREVFQDWVKSQHSPLVFNEAAILFETGMYKNYDVTILVTAPQEIRIERTIKRDHTTKENVIARMNSQWSDAEKIKLADFILINDDVTPLLSQIESTLDQLIQ